MSYAHRKRPINGEQRGHLLVFSATYKHPSKSVTAFSLAHTGNQFRRIVDSSDEYTIPAQLEQHPQMQVCHLGEQLFDVSWSRDAKSLDSEKHLVRFHATIVHLAHIPS